MITNRNPEYFLTVAREGNISHAAQKLYISQPSLSQHIAKLEESLGTKLFDRSKTPLSLTPAGELYRNYLESSDFLYRKFEADLSGLHTQSALNVNIGFGSWRGSILLPDILPEFLGLHPQAQVFLHEYPVNELAPLVRAGDVDFAVMNTVPGSAYDDLVLETIVYERILLVMNRRDKAAQQFIWARDAGEPLPLKDLAGRRLITLSRSLSVGRLVENYLEKNRIPVSHRISATNNTTVLKLVAAGMGFCFLVETGLVDAKRYPNLIFFDMRSEDLMLPLSLCYRKGTYLSPAAQDMIRVIFSHSRQVVENNRRLLV
ncbi:MAG: LysR family transcriptional regulator [Lachnospiraceae bacterium]|nr:LysR family transcriptional regulator [Lachnospiraceae bacterium]